MVVSVLYKELECNVEEVGGHAAEDQKQIRTSNTRTNHPGSVKMTFCSPGGVLAEKLGRGVRPASQNPYPIYDQNLRFSLPYL